MRRKINHGEVVLKEVNGIPKGAKKLLLKNFVVVGESETKGNDHRVAVMDDTEVYEENGTLYIKNETASKVFCPNPSRHSEETLPASTWKVNIAQEFDYVMMEKRNVAD